MSDAAKHLDPQTGVDIHMYAIPPGPLPTPHIGQVMDPFDYIPGVSTVTLNGVHRGVAGTAGTVVHVPLGVFAPGEGASGGPQPDGEVIFMGSRTVSADGEPFSRLGMQVLDCNHPGMSNPSRKKPAPPQKTNSLPTGTNQAVPSHVKIGGEPVVMAQGGKKEEPKKNPLQAQLEGMAEQAKQITESALKAWKRFLIGTLPGFILDAAALRADPVDIRDGSVVIDCEDFSIPGRLPLVWRRSYASRDATTAGHVGFGWMTPADIALHLSEGPQVHLRGPERIAYFADRPLDPADPADCLDFVDAARLSRTHEGWQVRFKDGLRMVFADAQGGAAAARVLPLSRIEDANGNHWRFERHGDRLLRIVESGCTGAQGRYLDIVSHAGRIDAIVLHDPGTGLQHPLVTYAYNSSGDLRAVTDAEGASRTYAYQSHLVVQHADRVGMRFNFAYDLEGRVLRNWGDGGLLDYTFHYDALLSETRITDSLGHQRIVKLDPHGLPLCEIDPLDGVTFYEYDTFGRTVAITDPMGLRTTFGYDARRNRCCITRPDGSGMRQQYDHDDRLVMLELFDGSQWHFAYDAHGRQTGVTNPLGARTEYRYDDHGQFVAQVDARQATTQLRYDRHGLVAAITDPLGNEIHYQHDARGCLVATTDALGRTTRHQYDGAGRLLSSCAADGAVHRYRYDGEGQLIEYTDPAGACTRLHYAGTGHLARRVHPDGTSVEYLYDAEEQLVGVINPRDENHQLVRDALGRIVAEVDYWGQTTTYAYDAGGRLTSMTDPLGRQVQFQTDALGRITRRRYAHPHAANGIAEDTFEYDANSRMTVLQGPDRRVERVHDGLGQLLEERQDGFVIRYTYDPMGNRLRRESTTGVGVDYTYDLRGQLESVAVDGTPVSRFSHDAGLHRISQTLGGDGGLIQHFDYDAAGRMIAQSARSANGGALATRYHYGAGGHLSGCDDSLGGSEQFDHDALGRLLRHVDPQGQVHAYLNDAAGDRFATRVQGGSAADAPWQRSGRAGAISYTFDRAGCLLQRGVEAPGRTSALRLDWDGCQRLVETERDGVRTRYGYDAIGRRAFKRTGSHCTWFYWDGDELLSELSCETAGAADHSASAAAGGVMQTGQSAPPWPGAVATLEQRRQAREAQRHAVPTQAREYVMHPHTREPLLRLDSHGENDGGAALRYYQTRPNGAPMRLLDGQGRVLWHAALHGWGAADIASDAIGGNALRLLGQYLDEETGLHYNRHRYYDPALGTFISQDPSGLESGVSNLYEYAVNAQDFVDPLGLSPQRRQYPAALQASNQAPGHGGNPRLITRPPALQPLLGQGAGSAASGADAETPSTTASAPTPPSPPSFNDIFFGNRGRVQFAYGRMRSLGLRGLGTILSFPSSSSALPGYFAGQANAWAMNLLGNAMGAMLFGLGTLFSAICRNK